MWWLTPTVRHLEGERPDELASERTGGELTGVRVDVVVAGVQLDVAQQLAVGHRDTSDAGWQERHEVHDDRSVDLRAALVDVEQGERRGATDREVLDADLALDDVDVDDGVPAASRSASGFSFAPFIPAARDGRSKENWRLEPPEARAIGVAIAITSAGTRTAMSM